MSDELVLLRSQMGLTLAQVRVIQARGLFLIIAILAITYFGIAAKLPHTSEWDLFEFMFARIRQSPGSSLSLLLVMFLFLGLPQLGLAIRFRC